MKTTTNPTMKTKTTLEHALPIVQSMEWVQSALIWTPDSDEIAEYKADGIDAQPTLEVTVWKCHRNPSNVVAEIESLGLKCIGDGSSIMGPCYSFIPANS